MGKFYTTLSAHVKSSHVSTRDTMGNYNVRILIYSYTSRDPLMTSIHVINLIQSTICYSYVANICSHA